MSLNFFNHLRKNLNLSLWLKCSIGLVFLTIVTNTFATSHYINIINNSDMPLTYSFNAIVGNAYSNSDTVAAHSETQKEIQLTDTYRFKAGDTSCKTWMTSCTRGVITITRNGQSGQFSYYGVAGKDSLNALDYESGPSPFPDVTTHIGAAPTKKTGSETECNGSYGCIIVNPPATWVESTLALQNKIDQFEPLNVEQFIGTHNSAVSANYVPGFIEKFAAANQYLAINTPPGSKEHGSQLNDGVRSLELDILEYKGEVRICHLHDMKWLDRVCSGSSSLADVLGEIETWLAANPNQLLFLYLDVNDKLPSDGAKMVDQNLDTTFGTKIYTVADAYPNLPKPKSGSESSIYDLPLDLTKITQYQLLNMVPNKKQVIVTAKEGEGVDNDYDVFTSAKGDKSPELPHDTGINKVYADYQSGGCAAVIKYFSADDPAHSSIWRLNGDRALISGADRDYVTVAKIQALQKCPVNWFSVDQLVSRDYKNDALDARLATQIWSWEEGYPLNTANLDADANNNATINPATGKFKNDVAAPILALCYDVTSPRDQSRWKVMSINAVNQAEMACQAAGKNWHFAVPTTSYQMASVITTIGQQDTQHLPVLVNYNDTDGQWIANDSKALNKLS